MRLRRGVEAVTALLWLASGRFLAWHQVRYPIGIVERRTTRIGVLERIGSSYGCSCR